MFCDLLTDRQRTWLLVIKKRDQEPYSVSICKEVTVYVKEKQNTYNKE